MNEDLERSRLKEQIGLLVRALRAELESVRESVIVQLSLFGPKAVPYLTTALSNGLVEAKSRGNYARSDAELAVVGIVRVLGIIRDPTSVESVGNALPRKEAMEVLSKFGGAKALDLMLGSIVAPLSSYGRQSAVRDFVGSDSGFHRGESTEESNDDFLIRVFLPFGDSARERLRAELALGPSEKRAAAASILRVLKDTNSTAQLIRALESGDSATKIEVAKALVALSAKEAVPSLVGALFEAEEKDDESEARSELKKAILELGNADSWVTVGCHVKSAYPEMHSEFREAVIKSGEVAIPALMKQLTASDKTAQSLAAEMIAEIKDAADPNKRHGY